MVFVALNGKPSGVHLPPHYKNTMATHDALHILIIDDSEDDAFLLVHALERSGYSVDWVRVERESELLGQLHKRHWDVVISDFNMPDFDAHRALEIMQASGLDRPFIVVSGAVGEEKAVEMMLAGAHDFVVKQNLSRLGPVVQRELREAQLRRERRRDVEQLQLQAAALDSAANGILITDRHGIIEWVNQAFTQLTGYRLGEAVGKPVSLLKSGRQSAEFYEDLWKTILSGKNWHGELVNRRKDGSEYVEEQSITSVRSEDGQISHFISIQQDITERTRAIQEREDLQRQLQQAHKMEALGQLTGGIAHDFNNILGAIIGYTDLALERFASTSDAKLGEYLNQVYSAAIRARDLIAQMLAYSRSSGTSEQIVRVVPVVKEVINMLRSAMPATVEFHTEFAEKIVLVRIDPVRLHQMVMNLCINARDAMEGHGKLTIRLRVEHDVQAVCSSCHHKLEGDFVRLDVEDTGTGIDEDTLSRIFEPFFTTKAVGSGTGMGLSVVHGILHEHQGHVLVETLPGKGTVFSLLLPSLKSTAVEETPQQYSSAVMPRGHGHVLVVDDEAHLVNYYAELLEGQGYRVTGITDAREALGYFKRAPDDVDLVITDQTMPEMTGARLAQEILDIRPELPVILCTGYSDEVDADSAKTLQVAEYFQKPVLPADLIHRVAELIGEH